MKCPLLLIGWNAAKAGEQVYKPDCLKWECAWWEPKIGKCAVLRMWIALQDIHEALHDIAANITLRGKR